MDFNKFCENGNKIKLTEEKKAEIINICKENEVQEATHFSLNFKSFAVAICVLIIAVTAAFAYKNHNDTNDIPVHSATEQSEKESLKAVEITSVQSPQKIENTTENDVGGGEIVQEKYRQCYYNISYQLSLLVDENELKDWEEEIYAKDPNETNEMVVKLFVQHFNISKEDFERANLEAAKVIYDPNSPPLSMNPKDYINQEMFELYNPDIIYTFDDEIINEYYLSGEYPFVYESDFEEAVASGEHTPLTEDWIDIEQMEAEINSKYGETEIVTEITTTIPEEITSTALSPIETNE